MRLVFDAYTSFSQVLWKQVQHNSNFLGGEREDRRGGGGNFSIFSPNAGKYGPEKSVFGHFSRSASITVIKKCFSTCWVSSKMVVLSNFLTLHT